MSREPKNIFITKARKMENTKRDDSFFYFVPFPLRRDVFVIDRYF